MANVAGDGVIVSDDGAEISVATGCGSGGAVILACIAGIVFSSPLTPEDDAVAELVTLCPCPLSSDGITADFEVTAFAKSVTDVGGRGREGGVARDSDWG